MFKQHLARLKNKLKKQHIPAYLCSSPADIFYLTGLPSEGLTLLVTPKSSTICTSLMYKDYAVKNLPGFKIDVHTDLIKSLHEFLRKSRIKKLWVDKHTTTVEQAEKLRKMRGCRICFESSLIEDLRIIKGPEEINRIRKACRMTAQIVRTIRKYIHYGIRETGLAGKISMISADLGAKSAFDTIVSFGSHTSEPHHIADLKKLHKSMPVMIDAGVKLNGYCGDLTRMFYLGKIDGFYSQIYHVVDKAKKAAQALVKPGVKASEIDEAGRLVFREAGYEKFFTHSTGHGIGIDVHERPKIAHKSNDVIKSGMVITIEPGLYFPGRFGVRIEDTLVVTKNGYQILTKT
ncbi:MAG: Xaa-Pro peptidase family protein [bacterium]